MSGILVGVLGTLAVLFLLRALAHLAWRRRWRGRRRGFGLYRVFRRLEATPEQERLLAEGLEGVRAELRAIREGLFASREDLARALAADSLDRQALESLWARQLERAGAAKDAFVAAAARFHASLEPRQRTALAELVRAGGLARGRC